MIKSNKTQMARGFTSSILRLSACFGVGFVGLVLAGSAVAQSEGSTTQPSLVKSVSTVVDPKVAANLRQILQKAGIRAKIVSIESSKLPNLYQVNLQNQPPLHMTADGHYVLGGQLQKNPSPRRDNSQIYLQYRTRKVAEPVAPLLRQFLLANMSALKNMSAQMPLYHTAIAGVLWGVTLEGVPFLLSDDGQYFTDGEISVIENGRLMGLDAQFERKKNQQILQALDKNTLISYPAKGQEKAQVFVATDIQCPYCRRFHRLIPSLNQRGISVHSIGYPIYEGSSQMMQKIWCQTDTKQRQIAFDTAMTSKSNVGKTCDKNHLIGNRNLSAGLAVSATPAIFRSDGTLFEGNFETDEFLQFLGVR